MSKLDKIFTLSIILIQISLVLLTLKFDQYGIVTGITAIVLLFYGLLRGVLWPKIYNLIQTRKN